MKTAEEIFRKHWSNHKTEKRLLLSGEDQNMIESAMQEYADQFRKPVAQPNNDNAVIISATKQHPAIDDNSITDIERKAIYTVEYIKGKDGKLELKRKSEGFSALELLGVLVLTKDEIIAQLKGTIKPDIIKRQVVTD